MATCDYRDLKCTECGGVIHKGSTFTGSEQRPRHWGGCPPRQQKAIQRPARPVLDSYEQECEDEGVSMTTRYGYRSY